MSPCREPSLPTWSVKGRAGIVADDPRHSVAPIERPLGASEHLDTRDAGEVKVEARLIEHRHSI